MIIILNGLYVSNLTIIEIIETRLVDNDGFGFVMLILYYINGPAQEYQEIQSNQTENSPLPCPSINVKSS